MLQIIEKLNFARDGYSNFDIYRHLSPGDGHCLIHSVAFSVYPPYRTKQLNGVAITQRQVVEKFRTDIANRLERVDIRTGRSLYDTVARGGLRNLGLADPEYYSLDALQKLLRSSNNLGQEILVVLENLLNINIFVLDHSTQDVIHHGVNNDNRRSIILYYTGQHYDAITRKVGADGIHVTLLKETDSLIKFLRLRIKNRPKDYNKQTSK